MRLLLREVPDFLPASGFVSELLTLHILTTGQSNMRCLTHIHDRRIAVCDRDVEIATDRALRGELTLTGVDGEPNPAGEARNLSGGKRLTHNHGLTHLDCGCAVQDAVFQYWLWKNWRLDGMDGQVTEPMNGPHLLPRLRNAIHQGLVLSGGLDIIKLFPGKLIGEEAAREILIEAQLRTLTSELVDLRMRRGVALDARSMWSIVGACLNSEPADSSGGESSRNTSVVDSRAMWQVAGAPLDSRPARPGDSSREGAGLENNPTASSSSA